MGNVARIRSLMRSAPLSGDTDKDARDRLVTAGKVAPDATPEQAVEAFRAARLLLDMPGDA